MSSNTRRHAPQWNKTSRKAHTRVLESNRWDEDQDLIYGFRYDVSEGSESEESFVEVWSARHNDYQVVNVIDVRFDATKTEKDVELHVVSATGALLFDGNYFHVEANAKAENLAESSIADEFKVLNSSQTQAGDIAGIDGSDTRAFRKHNELREEHTVEARADRVDFEHEIGEVIYATDTAADPGFNVALAANSNEGHVDADDAPYTERIGLDANAEPLPAPNINAEDACPDSASNNSASPGDHQVVPNTNVPPKEERCGEDTNADHFTAAANGEEASSLAASHGSGMNRFAVDLDCPSPPRSDIDKSDRASVPDLKASDDQELKPTPDWIGEKAEFEGGSLPSIFLINTKFDKHSDDEVFKELSASSSAVHANSVRHACRSIIGKRANPDTRRPNTPRKRQRLRMSFMDFSGDLRNEVFIRVLEDPNPPYNSWRNLLLANRQIHGELKSLTKQHGLLHLRISYASQLKAHLARQDCSSMECVLADPVAPPLEERIRYAMKELEVYCAQFHRVILIYAPEVPEDDVRARYCWGLMHRIHNSYGQLISLEDNDNVPSLHCARCLEQRHTIYEDLVSCAVQLVATMLLKGEDRGAVREMVDAQPRIGIDFACDEMESRYQLQGRQRDNVVIDRARELEQMLWSDFCWMVTYETEAMWLGHYYRFLQQQILQGGRGFHFSNGGHA